MQFVAGSSRPGGVSDEKIHHPQRQSQQQQQQQALLQQHGRKRLTRPQTRQRPAISPRIRSRSGAFSGHAISISPKKRRSYSLGDLGGLRARPSHQHPHQHQQHHRRRGLDKSPGSKFTKSPDRSRASRSASQQIQLLLQQSPLQVHQQQQQQAKRPTAAESPALGSGSFAYRYFRQRFSSSVSADAVCEQPGPARTSSNFRKSSNIEEEMPTSAPNIFAMLSRMYTMGETTGPSIFRTGLSSQCVHTLYAGSFIVYTLNLIADWLHVYYACKGWTVTFALRPWFTVLMICCCVSGSVCNFLLFYLCVENALRRKWDVQPFRNGCRLVCQRLSHWILDFDCFRVSLLILLLENAPMTFVNYWFISSCTVPAPRKMAWPFAFACSATILSVVWRGVMAFLAYRNLKFCKKPDNSKKPTPSSSLFMPIPQSSSGQFQPIAHQQMTIGEIQHQKLEAKTSSSSAASTMEELRSLAAGDRTDQYDECWPLRMSCWIMYQKDEPDGDSNTAIGGEASGRRSLLNIPSVRPPDNCLGYCCQACCCCCLCLVFYVGMLISGCAPCLYHYTCRRNSLYHRTKFSRTCTTVCSTLYNVSVLIITVILVVSLLVMNFIWLGSVQVIGNNRTPPEISKICLFVNRQEREVVPAFMSTYAISYRRPGDAFDFECKQLFMVENRYGFRWHRISPGPWKYQKSYDEKNVNEDNFAIRLTTQIKEAPNDTMKIHAQFLHGSSNQCNYRTSDNWTISDQIPIPIAWPYWTACYRDYAIIEHINECEKGV